MSEFAGYTLSNQEQVDEFREKYPDGYTMLNGDRGIGLVGAYADKARVAQSSGGAWRTPADKLKPWQ